MTTQLVYVGAYTRPLAHVEGRAEGIYTYSLDMATGALTEVHMAPGHATPSYPPLAASGRRLYAVKEMNQGWAKALVADPKTGALPALTQQPPNGGAPVTSASTAQ